MYETDVPDETLAEIRAAEADFIPASLSGKRFRRLFNEIERLKIEVADLGQRLSSSEAARVKTGYRGGWGR